MKNEALPIEPIRAKAEDLERFEAGDNFYFRATEAVVNILPRGKVLVARWLGNRFSARGITKTATGVSLAIDDSNIDFFAELAKHGGTWEDDVRKECIRLLSPGDVFYDIGANAGFVSLEVGVTSPIRSTYCHSNHRRNWHITLQYQQDSTDYEIWMCMTICWGAKTARANYS